MQNIKYGIQNKKTGDLADISIGSYSHDDDSTVYCNLGDGCSVGLPWLTEDKDLAERVLTQFRDFDGDLNWPYRPVGMTTETHRVVKVILTIEEV